MFVNFLILHLNLTFRKFCLTMKLIKQLFKFFFKEGADAEGGKTSRRSTEKGAASPLTSGHNLGKFVTTGLNVFF